MPGCSRSRKSSLVLLKMKAGVAHDSLSLSLSLSLSRSLSLRSEPIPPIKEVLYLHCRTTGSKLSVKSFELRPGANEKKSQAGVARLKTENELSSGPVRVSDSGTCLECWCEQPSGMFSHWKSFTRTRAHTHTRPCHTHTAVRQPKSLSTNTRTHTPRIITAVTFLLYNFINPP